jgi:hypothetical protein
MIWKVTGGIYANENVLCDSFAVLQVLQFCGYEGFACHPLCQPEL